MCKSEIFVETINLVSQETEIPAERILSPDKDAETVDARYLLVSLLADRGMYPSQIAVHIHKTKRAVNYMISNFRNRDYVGGFYVSLRQAIPAGTTATLPILIGTNGDTRPLLAYNNEPVTVGNLAGTGIYEIHYNKYTNELFLVNGGYRPTTTTAPTAETIAQKSK